MVGRFRLSGTLVYGEEAGGVRLRVPFIGVGGEAYLREIPLVLGSDDAAYLRYNWRSEATAIVEGDLEAARDTLRLQPHSLFLLQSPIDPPLNEAVLWGYVRERASESVYLLASSSEAEEMFPVESLLPLRVGRSYHMVGLLSPRLYPRQGLLQVRFKVQQAREHIAVLQPRGTGEVGQEPGGGILRQFFVKP